jgi:hypothetical protein
MFRHRVGSVPHNIEYIIYRVKDRLAVKQVHLYSYNRITVSAWLDFIVTGLTSICL